MAAFEERRHCDDARTTCTGRYGAWLRKVKNDDAIMKWIVMSTTRYFTIDFEDRVLYCSRSESDAGMSPLCAFEDILTAELLLPTFGFAVETQGRTYELYSTSHEDAARWVSGLNTARALGKAGGGDGARATEPKEECVPGGVQEAQSSPEDARSDKEEEGAAPPGRNTEGDNDRRPGHQAHEDTDPLALDHDSACLRTAARQRPGTLEGGIFKVRTAMLKKIIEKLSGHPQAKEEPPGCWLFVHRVWSHVLLLP